MAAAYFTKPLQAQLFFQKLQSAVLEFYQANPHIQLSHGWQHAQRVCGHASEACRVSQLDQTASLEICAAALLHDADDLKYFPGTKKGTYPNAMRILTECHVAPDSQERIRYMINLVSCSKNGNRVPEKIRISGDYHLLIPRWSDRIEAVGKRGVVRCYQFNREIGAPLSSDQSPRATTEAQVWAFATPERFERYQSSGGSSHDMVSHYYDKLLHVACPPASIVRNEYLELELRNSAKELIEVCLRYGRTGKVDKEYIQHLQSELDGNVIK